jgi:hypothetical protein
MYDFQRCPKIVAIKAYNAFKAIREQKPAKPGIRLRDVEPATIGSIGEAAVKLGLAGVPLPEAIQQIAIKIPQVNVSDCLRRVAAESLADVEVIRKDLFEMFGDISIIGKGEGRIPDLAGTVQPDYIALGLVGLPSKRKAGEVQSSED